MNLNLNYENTSEALNIFINDSLLFDPGTKYSYSTHAWTLLSLAMEKAYGENFIELMKNEILNPLQLNKTFAEEIEPVKFGIRENVKTFNPIKITFMFWQQMVSDFKNSKNQKERLLSFFGKPEWKP